MQIRQFFLGGKWTDSSPRKIQLDLNPVDGSTIAQVHQAQESDVDRAIQLALKAQAIWREQGPSVRESMLLNVASILERRTEDIAAVLVKEAGCNLGNGMYNVFHSVGDLRAKAGDCRRICGETIPTESAGAISLTLREPLGVVAAIAPFNFPFVLASVKVSSALATGNAVILKPSEYTPISALLLAEAYDEAGLPEGLLSVLPGGNDVGRALVNHKDIKLVAFTGSSRTGKSIAQSAAASLKRVCLELGGVNPLIIMDDVDMEYAIDTAVFGAFNHQGQVCMASSKILIHESIHDAFVEKLIERTQSLKVGDPSQADTVIGPLISQDSVLAVHAAVQKAEEAGASIACGGQYEGACYQPTILINVHQDMPIFHEEVFGPVLTVTPFSDIGEAVSLANNSDYGLSSAVLTNDINKAMLVARKIDAGMVHINGTTVQCEPQAPFGGVKMSGLGRESTKGYIDQMTEIKWVTIASQPSEYPF
ncbi:MAG: aldehyde dehydrogenase family protein [Halieaceae bacterium]|nr:aldehyde dehydrogenase family protein [Halieaceae bacterium]